MTKKLNNLGLTVVAFILVACGGSETSIPPLITNPPPVVVVPEIPVEVPIVLMPSISDVKVLTAQARKYDRLDLEVELNAEFDNPYDLRQINLMATFTGPNNLQMAIPGFWDIEGSWIVRFSPPTLGVWQYSVTVEDTRGISSAFEAQVDVQNSELRGWVLPGNQVDSSYSKRYLAYHDGSPFYGFGHGDAFSVFFSPRADSDTNNLIREMKEAGENYVLFWPHFNFSIVRDDYQQYDLNNAVVLDTFIERMRLNDLHIIYTFWDHSHIRDESHPWGNSRWHRNGFSGLTSVSDFFVDDEAWEWQKNLYRYSIARWGYSSSIAMWQTVSEIDGTNAFENTNFWHARVNQYFVEHDPYRHPTTASMAGDLSWDIGHEVMDVPQVHIYNDLIDDVNPSQGLTIKTAEVIAGYTSNMWTLQEKPNWIGEFGVLNSNTPSSYYPELFHNALWAGLASGAAMTPAEWNDDFDWQDMTTEMKTHMRYLANFMSDIPLVVWAPKSVVVEANAQLFQAWGLTAPQGTIIWGLDTTHKGLDISDIRALRSQRSGVIIKVQGLASGEYRVYPFNTWTGLVMESYLVFCDTAEQGCDISVPAFISDIALKIIPVS